MVGKGSGIWTLADMRDFEDILSGLVDEIFNPSVDFTQTEDANSCMFCPYKTLCSRN
jgi:hypothetical protein